jgi:hypothetical protein
VALAVAAGIWVLTRRGDSGDPDAEPESPPQAGPPRAGEAPPAADDQRAAARVTPLHEVNSAGRPGGDAPVVRPGGDVPVGRLGGDAPGGHPAGNELAGGDSYRLAVPPPVPTSLWTDGYAQSVRERWRDLQLRFIDDPQYVANEAERVVDETVGALTASLNRFKGELDAWRSGPGDTEQLRTAVYRYRDFLDRLLGS